MYYCIEDDEICLTTVPSRWVINGLLYWSNTKNINKLLMDPNSKPDPNKWSVQPCTINRKGNKTLVMTRSMENEMQHVIGKVLSL